MIALLHLIPALICMAIGVMVATDVARSQGEDTALDMVKGGLLVAVAFIGAAISLSEALAFAIGHAIGGAR
jgi:hypothetical protein